MFYCSFCAIFWLKERGKLINSLGKSNEWTARDEALHTEFAVLLYKYIQNRITEEEAQDIMRDAVRIEIRELTIDLHRNFLCYYREVVTDIFRNLLVLSLYLFR